MYHAPSPRTRIAKRLASMFVSSLAVVIGVVILAAITLGYSFNSEDGLLERGGIMQIIIKP